MCARACHSVYVCVVCVTMCCVCVYIYVTLCCMCIYRFRYICQCVYILCCVCVYIYIYMCHCVLCVQDMELSTWEGMLENPPAQLTAVSATVTLCLCPPGSFPQGVRETGAV